MLDHGLIQMLFYLSVLYFPSIIFGYVGLKAIHNINNNKDFQLFLKGMRTTSLGFIFSIVPSLWNCTCLENKYYHWVFGTLIVMNGWYWFYKRKFLLGSAITIFSSIIVAVITDRLSSSKNE